MVVIVSYSYDSWIYNYLISASHH